MPLILILLIVAWFVFGDPPKNVANWFWPKDAAPWESVDAFYYPNRSDLLTYQAERGLKSVQECREWVYFIAARNGDGSLLIGDYECGVEQIDTFGSIPVYRLTVR